MKTNRPEPRNPRPYRCGACGSTDFYSYFCKSAGATYRRCRPCRANEPKANVTRWRMKARYGTTPEEVEEFRAVQGNRCAICRRGGIELVIDHDHASGRIRALLCRPCNLLLGYSHEDPVVLERAAAYVTPGGKMSPIEDPA